MAHRIITDHRDPELHRWFDWHHAWKDPVTIPQTVDLGTSHITFKEVSIVIDIQGPLSQARTTVSQAGNHDMEFPCNMPAGIGLILADNISGIMPIHLFFTPPLRAFGTYISGDAPMGTAYNGCCRCVLAAPGKRQWIESTTSSTNMEQAQGPGADAPFFGLIADSQGPGIQELWFDVNAGRSNSSDAANLQADPFGRVAIGRFYFQV
ncbi:hypothetical protein ACSFA3_08910 [Variovorax sp. RHLX14]|uniref:hypothetical protein n=1 Tax=Variovorax sp. RHLX14 TaxID=1259731 RepID=UPI003F48D51E